MKISPKAKHAILIGTLCSVSYFVVYIARNILGAVTPQMMEAGFAESVMGNASSLFFICYAVGQLINGAIGDKIHGKWMICVGLLGAGILCSFYPTMISGAGGVAGYGCIGFFLSMIYGPMTKLASENTEPVYATRCAVGYDFASCVGSPVAGLMAAFLTWQAAFYAGGLGLIIMAVAAFVCFTALERKKIIRYGAYTPQKSGKTNIKLLLSHKIIKFSLVSIITGVVRTSVVFWLPTYLAQYLEYSAQTAAKIFTVAALVMSATTFIAVFIYEKMGHDMDKVVLLMFSSAVVFFTLTYFVGGRVWNICCIVLAIMSSNGAASILWSRYCPSLRDTGMVSTVTGYLDFLSYMAAAIANLVFANAVSAIGWGNLILVWLGLMILGVVVALPYDKWRKR